MPRPAKFTKEQLEAALRASEGDYLRAAVQLKVNLATVYRAIKRYGVAVPKGIGAAGRIGRAA